MAVRPVLVLPDRRLSQPAVPVGKVDDAARAVADDLIDTMRVSPACVGLAATQLGVLLRVFVIDVTGHRKARSSHGEVVLFDPEVVLARGRELAREGCMSVPDLTGDVARATTVVVRGTTPDGTDRVLEVEGFEARAVLHEFDHLDGLLFLDRVSSPEAVFRRRVYR